MGREIRKIPKGWEHPKEEDGVYTVLHEYEDHECNCNQCDINDEDYYMPPVIGKHGYALYENVSEGTPITPTFETKEELADYLVEEGDFLGNNWNRESAKKMTETGYAPSMILQGGVMYSPHNFGNLPPNPPKVEE